jgi:hypothetical protein
MEYNTEAEAKINQALYSVNNKYLNIIIINSIFIIHYAYFRHLFPYLYHINPNLENVLNIISE